METALHWLVGLEPQAADLYRQAADLLRADEHFASFLDRLSEDELRHRALVTSASEEFLRGDYDEPPAVIVDAVTRLEVEQPLHLGQALVASGEATRKQLLACIANIEFAEWNEIFVYFVSHASRTSRTAGYAAAVIQAHRDRIESFLGTLPPDLQPDLNLSALPAAREQRFLLVDDDPELLHLLARFLRRKARIETAADSAEALQKATATFFDVIVSDINMPRMDGLEFFRRLVEADPRMHAHFLVCSGNIDASLDFLQGQRLPYLHKPFTLPELGQAIAALTERTTASM